MPSAANKSIANDSTTLPPSLPHPLFRLGFRPLFLSGVIISSALIAWWAIYWSSLMTGDIISWSPVGGAIWWHAHEMIFGFSAAIIGGFLLTAVRNWTGIPTITGLPLALLVLIWWSARLLMAFGSALPSWLVLVVDELFLLGVAVAIGYPIVKAQMWRNLMFIPILLILASLNAVSHSIHFEHLFEGDFSSLSMNALHSAALLVCLMIVIIGGRILPFFTANGLKIPKVESIPLLELGSILSLLGVVGLAFYGFNRLDPVLVGSIALLSGVINFIRFARWQFWLCGNVPLLWSLHLFYLCVPLGLIALGINSLMDAPHFSSVLHILTVGAIGGMILTMIVRVSLGHTGRPLKASGVTSAAFIIFTIAIVVRTVLTVTFPELSTLNVMISAGLWVCAYLIFVWGYGPYLWSARPDGKPM